MYGIGANRYKGDDVVCDVEFRRWTELGSVYCRSRIFVDLYQ